MNISLSHSWSLKVIENGAIRKLIFAFHSNWGRIFNRFDTIHERDGQTDRRTTAQAALVHASRDKNAFYRGTDPYQFLAPNDPVTLTFDTLSLCRDSVANFL